MSITLTLSDDIYHWLQEEAATRGVGSVELALEQIRREGRIRRRQQVGKRIDEHREQLFAKYGVMPDSTELVREDRER
ncbi:MAG: hypothetical protein M3437_13405 [Chloroflexota bacterium]|nr:hypothetical protein [Chloroflexota bacterium]MDQ5866039.1 hypothetical protein [Chloroflexota bacterium]